MALTRQVLAVAGMHVYEDEHAVKIIAASSRFWAEHSSRASLASVARVLHDPKQITDRMRWSSIGSEAGEEYIRTYRTLIVKVQEKVASTIREAAKEEKHRRHLWRKLRPGRTGGQATVQQLGPSYHRNQGLHPLFKKFRFQFQSCTYTSG